MFFIFQLVVWERNGYDKRSSTINQHNGSVDPISPIFASTPMWLFLERSLDTYLPPLSLMDTDAIISWFMAKTSWNTLVFLALESQDGTEGGVLWSHLVSSCVIFSSIWSQFSLVKVESAWVCLKAGYPRNPNGLKPRFPHSIYMAIHIR